MSDTKSVPAGVKLLNRLMDEIAQEIGQMHADDPRRNKLVKAVHRLGQLGFLLRSKIDGFINERMDQLARNAEALKPADRRHEQIRKEILRLSNRHSRLKD